MRLNRIHGLIGVMLIMGLLRWQFPPEEAAASDGVVAAVPRDSRSGQQPLCQAGASGRGAGASGLDCATLASEAIASAAPADSPELEGDIVSAFAVPEPVRPSGPVGNGAAVAPQAPVAPKPPPPFVGPEQPPPLPPPVPPPPPPPPPLQVIGLYTDEHGSAVVLSSAKGVQLARVGDVVLDDYKVSALSAQQVVLHQQSSKRSWPMPIPVAAPNQPVITYR